MDSKSVSGIDHLKHISYPDVDINEISILIGCDNFDLIAPREIHYGPPNTARAIQTELGWTASGKLICLQQ